MLGFYLRSAVTNRSHCLRALLDRLARLCYVMLNARFTRSVIRAMGFISLLFAYLSRAAAWGQPLSEGKRWTLSPWRLHPVQRDRPGL